MVAAPRCSYCTKASVVWFERQSWLIRRGHRQVIKLDVGACAEHENSPNWKGLVEFHKPALLQRGEDQ